MLNFLAPNFKSFRFLEDRSLVLFKADIFLLAIKYSFTCTILYLCLKIISTIEDCKCVNQEPDRGKPNILITLDILIGW